MRWHGASSMDAVTQFEAASRALSPGRGSQCAFSDMMYKDYQTDHKFIATSVPFPAPICSMDDALIVFDEMNTRSTPVILYPSKDKPYTGQRGREQQDAKILDVMLVPRWAAEAALRRQATDPGYRRAGSLFNASIVAETIRKGERTKQAHISFFSKNSIFDDLKW